MSSPDIHPPEHVEKAVCELVSDLAQIDPELMLTCKEARQYKKHGPTDHHVLWLHRYLYAMQSELIQAQHSLPWRWWRTDEDGDIDAVRACLANVFLFLLQAVSASGMNGSDLISLYYQNRKEYFNRST